MISLSGSRVLVIGGSGGIGLATARLAAELGAHVTVASRSPDRVAAAVAGIGPTAQGRVVDVTSDESVQALFEDKTQWDHVIVTGSQVTIQPVRQLPLDTARAAFDSKFWGFYRVAKFANITAGGSLSVLTGFLGTRPAAGRALMGAINASLDNLVKGLALELKPVRVNAVSPGMTNSTMWAEMDSEARSAMFARAAGTYPAGRVGEPDEIARQLLLLAATGFATGTVVLLDGGASIA
jgi:NAD(P)-dependent dehydrogenase (short-subunit alcohol dehydrogenase family)